MPKKFSDTSKDVRQQRIYDLLKYCGEDSSLTVGEIQHRLFSEGIKTSTKTIQRDVQEDMQLTHRIQGTETKPARYYCDPDYKPDYQLTFSEAELQTMLLSLEGFKEMSAPHMKELAVKTEVILMSKLPRGIADEFQKLKSFTIVTPAFRGESAVENTEAFRLVLKALRDGVVITCCNTSPYKDEEFAKKVRTFSPLYLHMAGSEHYLMAYDHEDHLPKRLKICRLENIKLSADKIDKTLRSKHKDLTNTIGGFGGTDEPVVLYTITCDKIMATLFQERKIHSSQKIIRVGSSYKIAFESNPSKEIIRELAGWAKHIQDVEPKEVLEELREIWQAGLSQKAA